MSGFWERKDVNELDRVLDTIGELVDDSLANRRSRDVEDIGDEDCELCGEDWHGLPELHGERTCPGAWATDEDVKVWREMFPTKSDQFFTDPGLSDRCGFGAASAWMFTRAAKHAIIDNSAIAGGDYRVALLRGESNINEFTERYEDLTHEHPDGGGYTTGGLRVTIGTTTNRAFTVGRFVPDPVWVAGGTGIRAHWAVIYNDDLVLCYCRLCQVGDVVATTGSTLTICGNRLFTLSL